MEERQVLTFKESETGELVLNFCGMSKTEPMHSSGPAVKPHYIIHYILEGEGEYQVNGNRYRLKAGQGFLIEPDELVFYRADQYNPWQYIWVGFSGLRAKEILTSFGLSTGSPIFQSMQADKLRELVMDMMLHHVMGYSHELCLTGLLYLFLSVIGEGRTKEQGIRERENIYVKKAAEFIRGNYHMGVKVKDVAAYVCINRSYLYTLFEKQLGMSPQQYLTTVRINKAKELLELTQFSIGSVSMSCGYRDIAAFTKAFRQAVGVTPTIYRRNH